MPMAVSGHNGNNETLIGMSYSLGLTFYDQNNDEIPVVKTQKPIDIVVQRDKNLEIDPFQYVNATGIGISPGSYFLPNGFSIVTNNASIHIELKPLSINIGYLIVLKYGYTPIVNLTFTDYSTFKLFCPSNLKDIMK